MTNRNTRYLVKTNDPKAFLLELQSFFYSTHCNLAKSLRVQGKLDEALSIYNRAIELKQDYFQAYNNRGKLFEDLHEYEQARKSYTMSLQIKPDYALAYSNRGAVEKKIGNYDGALRDFTKAIELDGWKENPSDQNLKSRLYVNLGDILMFFTQFDKALAAYDEALKIDADNLNLIGMKGNAVAALGRIKEGLQLKQEGFGVICFDKIAGVSISHGK